MTSTSPDGGPRGRQTRPLRHLPVVVSALCLVAMARMARHNLRYLFPCAAILALIVAPPLLARRRMRQILLSGDVRTVLGTWQSSIERVTSPETMAPLMAATAYAAYGWVDAARTALNRAVKGPAWDAAVEQRLFIEALLDTFQGDRATGLLKAEELERLPLPPAGLFARVRITRLRRGVVALARAFAHKSDRADAKRLKSAASSTPLMYWAMRYGAAVVAINRGDMTEARQLLAGAPTWPEQSAFRVFDAELRGFTAV